tara:strand:- start:77248 stop:77676 length:429 start_codon:yes stop_codon:yes gene_type:complete
MKTIHSYWAYLVLIVLLITVLNSIISYVKKRKFSQQSFRLGLFTLILSHIQLLIGLGWYFSSPYYKALKTNGSEVMGDPTSRLLAVEHPIMMVLAIILITIGWSKHKKKADDLPKYKTFIIFYGIGLLLILSRIPWNQWPTL